MTAPNETRATSLVGDAPTVEPSTTTFDARDRLAGRLDDMTVRQAAEGADPPRSNPTPSGVETTEEGLL